MYVCTVTISIYADEETETINKSKMIDAAVHS